MKLTPKLVVNVGGMFSGKSSELQRQGQRHILRGHKVLFLKPRIDNRYSEDEIVTHDGRRVKAVNVDVAGDDFLDIVSKDVDVVLIDEVQFFEDKLISLIDNLLVNGIRVYCSGLDLDFDGKPFGITPLLMAKADEVKKLHAVCDRCGEDAWVTPRKNDNKETIQLGEKDEYFPLCRKCYYEHKFDGFWGFKKC
ncbi:thymidine kinase [Bacillus paralicheniformis]|nr:thymidine kinase [Bacillus paralicheniformis]